VVIIKFLLYSNKKINKILLCRVVKEEKEEQQVEEKRKWK
jgi:hypothetical protein